MPSTQTVMRAAQKRLAESGIDNAAIDAKRLLMAATGLSSVEILLADAYPTKSDALRNFNQMIMRRIRREPVSRILGRRSFWSLELEISDAVLDPRPDTETLVGATLDVLGPTQEVRFLDLGCGSGCVLLSILSERRTAFGIGTDISATALQVAQSNAKKSGLSKQCTFVCADWLDGIKGAFDLIVVNPPYIRTGELGRLDPEVQFYDPVLALDGGTDGLDPLRAICGKALSCLKAGGRLLTELGVDSVAIAEELFLQTGFHEIQRVPDLDGRSRVLSGRRP